MIFQAQGNTAFLFLVCINDNESCPGLDGIGSHGLRNPTGKREASWICPGAAEELNQRIPSINPARSQSGTLSWDYADFQSGASTT